MLFGYHNLSISYRVNKTRIRKQNIHMLPKFGTRGICTQLIFSLSINRFEGDKAPSPTIFILNVLTVKWDDWAIKKLIKTFLIGLHRDLGWEVFQRNTACHACEKHILSLGWRVEKKYLDSYNGCTIAGTSALSSVHLYSTGGTRGARAVTDGMSRWRLLRHRDTGAWSLQICRRLQRQSQELWCIDKECLEKQDTCPSWQWWPSEVTLVDGWWQTKFLSVVNLSPD